MKDEELKLAWECVRQENTRVSRMEINDILDRKIKETKRGFYKILGISAFVSFTVIVLLIKASIERSSDELYVLNNVVLGLITLLSFVSALYSWYKLSYNNYAVSIKVCLERDIKMIAGSLYGRSRNVHLAVIPVIFTLLLLSIHTYFSGIRMKEILGREESVVALAAGFIIGMAVSFYVMKKLREYQVRNLEILINLYAKIKGDR